MHTVHIQITLDADLGYRYPRSRKFNGDESQFEFHYYVEHNSCVIIHEEIKHETSDLKEESQG